MTEEEWLACTDLPRLIKSQRDTGKDRKLRLFACSCARRIWDHLPTGSPRVAVEVSERFADCDTIQAELEGIYQTALTAWGEASLGMAATIYTGMAVAMPDASGAALYTSSHGPGVAVPSGTTSRKAIMAAERQAQLALFRDIFGNPFRHVTFDPNWRTSTAVALAQQMYESRDFAAMPILADALQDAGCDSADILDHCRVAGPHVRGCWVVDLILGKE